jgi:hypothetical protein
MIPFNLFINTIIAGKKIISLKKTMQKILPYSTIKNKKFKTSNTYIILI